MGNDADDDTDDDADGDDEDDDEDDVHDVDDDADGDDADDDNDDDNDFFCRFFAEQRTVLCRFVFFAKKSSLSTQYENDVFFASLNLTRKASAKLNRRRHGRRS